MKTSLFTDHSKALAHSIRHRLGRASGTLGISRVAKSASAFVGEELEFSGVVSSIDVTNGSVQIEIEERKKDGSLLMPAKTTVRLGGS